MPFHYIFFLHLLKELQYNDIKGPQMHGLIIIPSKGLDSKLHTSSACSPFSHSRRALINSVYVALNEYFSLHLRNVAILLEFCVDSSSSISVICWGERPNTGPSSAWLMNLAMRGMSSSLSFSSSRRWGVLYLASNCSIDGGGGGILPSLCRNQKGGSSFAHACVPELVSFSDTQGLRTRRQTIACARRSREIQKH